jgi:multiple sugar transport system substrate-binding protein
MKSKLLSLVTLLVMAAVVMTACTTTPEATEAPEADAPTEEMDAEEPADEPEEPAEAEPVTITFWNGLGSPENVVLIDMVNQFNETNTDGITVEVTELDWATLYSKVVLDYATGSAPDVLTMHQTNLIQNQDLGVLQPIDAVAAEAGLDTSDFVASAWGGTEIAGDHYAIPLDMHPLGLFYNVDAFEAAGLDPSQPPTSAEELIEYAKALTVDEDGDGTPEQWGIGLGYSGGTPFRTWMSLVWQHEGGMILNEDGTEAAFNSDAGIESLQFLHDLVYVEQVSPPSEQDPYDDFGRGLVAMLIEGPWGMGDFSAIETLNYATAMVPVVYDQPAAWGNSHTFAFPDNGKPEQTLAAMKFVKWMSDHNFEWSRDSGHQPVRMSVAESDDFKALTNWQPFAETVQYGHYYPAIIQTAEVFGREPTSPFVLMMESVLLDENADVEQAVADAAVAVNEILASE